MAKWLARTEKKLFTVWSGCRLLALAGRGAGGQVYWVWKCGEGWVFNCLEIHCDKVSCT